jgi:nitrite reductase/ring-hydroxylating ferredoxin subunit
MLPRAAYVDPAMFEWEQRNFFGGGWMCVARSEQLPQPGDQRAEATGTGGVLLVRAEDGALHAFANTCRHRGHELLPCGEGTQQARMIICPYHAWTYTLAGDLRAAGSFKKVRGFEFGSWGLHRLPATEWHGLIFVDTSGGLAGSLDEALAKLDEIIAPYEPERLVTAGRHSYDAAANWKILTENYHECYHCPSIHPELCRVSPPKSGENYASDGAWVGGWMDLRDGMSTMSLDGAGAAHRHLRQHPAERPAQPASGLRDDTPAYAGGRGQDPDRVHVGVRPGGGGTARVRPEVRGGVLGHHQPARLGCVRVGPARAVLAAGLTGAAGARRGRGVLVRHHHRPGLPRPDPVGTGSLAG